MREVVSQKVKDYRGPNNIFTHKGAIFLEAIGILFLWEV